MTRVALTVLLGLAVLVLLFPAGATDAIPPRCYSLLAYYYVPCDGWLAPAAGAAAAGIVGLAFWLRSRRGEHPGAR